jgi:glycine/D-amino acid oxidase-like deaminating enzyme
MGHRITLDGRYDVVVIGGGIVGCSSAYFLSKKGFNVVLVEAKDIASGASGHNAGFIWAHTRKPGPELTLVNETLKMLPQLPEELDYDFELRQSGGMIFFSNDDQAAIMSEFVDQRNKDGVTMQLLDRKEALEMAPILSDQVLGSTYCPLDALIHPTLYPQAFAHGARRLKTQIRTGTPVTAINVEQGRVTGVKTPQGDIRAQYVLLAAGAWTPQVAESLGLKIPVFPMRLQMLSTAPLENRVADRCLYGPVSAKQYQLFQDLPSYKDEAFHADYEWRYEMLLLHGGMQMVGGQFVFGMPMDYPGMVTVPDVKGMGMMTEALYTDYPMLRNVAVEKAWASLLPFTMDSLPIIDHIPQYEGLFVSAGHAFGNAAGPISGLLAAEMIAGESTTIDVSPFALDRLESQAKAPARSSKMIQS